MKRHSSQGKGAIAPRFDVCSCDDVHVPIGLEHDRGNDVAIFMAMLTKRRQQFALRASFLRIAAEKHHPQRRRGEAPHSQAVARTRSEQIQATANVSPPKRAERCDAGESSASLYRTTP